MTGPDHVEPRRRPADDRALARTVTLTKISVGPMDNNAYLLKAPGRRPC